MWPGAWQNQKHSHEGKELEAEDPTETKTGMGKEHDLSKGLSEGNYLSGVEGTLEYCINWSMGK